MAFVSERIKEEDKEYFNSIGFTQLAINEKVRPYWWVIDREREIIMTGRGRVFAEPIRGFQIYYMKNFVNIELVEWGEGDYYKKNVKAHYKIERVEIPHELIEKGVSVKEIKDLIYEMFMTARCFGFEPEVTIETTITMETEPIIV